MFERFTERARQVVVLAQDEARTLKHNYIGTEHILLGLLREEDGLAGRVLESLGVAVEEVRAQVARIVGRGDEAVSGQIAFTPRARKVLELAQRESLSLGHNYIATEQILLGLIREGEGIRGTDPGRLRCRRRHRPQRGHQPALGAEPAGAGPDPPGRDRMPRMRAGARDGHERSIRLVPGRVRRGRSRVSQLRQAVGDRLHRLAA
jgi:ATP-dependent Clp protease ATP-binding subunit ClpC